MRNDDEVDGPEAIGIQPYKLAYQALPPVAHDRRSNLSAYGHAKARSTLILASQYVDVKAVSPKLAPTLLHGLKLGLPR